ncbi:MAG: DUF551 domain-containing protein [Lachnospiraceae bacterium]|nr:DUF551 domain-containing protein [Lachnospiraceae bacterium]
MRPIDADKLKYELLTDNYDAKMTPQEVADCIDYQPTLSNEWIPCSERFPDKAGEYLVTYHPCIWDRVDDEIKVGLDSFRGKTTWAKRKYQRVIAWMPLPEGHKEK